MGQAWIQALRRERHRPVGWLRVDRPAERCVYVVSGLAPINKVSITDGFLVGAAAGRPSRGAAAAGSNYATVDASRFLAGPACGRLSIGGGAERLSHVEGRCTSSEEDINQPRRTPELVNSRTAPAAVLRRTP